MDYRLGEALDQTDGDTEGFPKPTGHLLARYGEMKNKHQTTEPQSKKPMVGTFFVTSVPLW